MLLGGCVTDRAVIESNWGIKKTLWPLFMDGSQMSEGYRGSLLFTTKSPGVLKTHFIDLEYRIP